MRSANERLVRLIRTLPRVDVQNRLMRASEREIAVSMRFMEERDRELVLSLVAAEKRRRIVEELALQRRLAVGSAQYARMIENLILLISSERYAGSVAHYLRPLRSRSEREPPRRP